MAKSKEAVATVDETMAQMMGAAQKKFGKSGTYVAADHEAAVPIVPFHPAKGWYVGGVNGIPLGRTGGSDGKSGLGKSSLSWDLIVDVLAADGIVVVIDNEERTSPDYIRSFIAHLPFEQRRRMIFHSTSSIDAWKSRVLFWIDQSQKLAEVPPEARVPMVILVDSLTGRGTEKDQADMKKEASSGYGTDAAKAISQFYQNLAFKGSLVTLLHVQHSYRSMDANARGDEEWVAKGGDRPRYSASFHVRPTSASTFEFADYQGKQMSLKCIKSSLGPDKRRIQVRLCWRFEWRELPVYRVEPALSDDEEPTYAIEEWGRELPYPEAFEWWESVNPHVPITLAEQLFEEMGLGTAGPEDTIKVPRTERQRVQYTWFDWDWALAWILIDHFKYGKVPAGEKKELESIVSFTNSGCNNDFIKCEQLFGDKTPHRYTEFGAAIMRDPELLRLVENFLGIKRYPHFRQVRSGLLKSGTKAEKKSK